MTSGTDPKVGLNVQDFKICFRNTNLEGDFIQELEISIHMKEILMVKESCRLSLPHKDHLLKLALFTLPIIQLLKAFLCPVYLLADTYSLQPTCSGLKAKYEFL